MTVTSVEPQVSRAELHALLRAAVRDAERGCGQDTARRQQDIAVGVLMALAALVAVYDVALLLGGVGA